MTTEDTEYEEPAKGEKAEAIRRKYCLENNHVYYSDDPCVFFKEGDKGSIEKNDDECYICFEASELDTIRHHDKLYFIKRIKD